MRKLAALAFALSSLALFAERDMAIYRGKLTSDLNANGNRITSVDLPLDAGDAANKEYVDAHGGCDTNAVDALANSAVVTNAITVAVTNRVAALETATNNLSSSVSGLANTKADKAAPSYTGTLAALTADGNLADSGKNASDFLPAKYLGGDAYEVNANTTFEYLYGDALVIDPYSHYFYGARFFYDPSGTESIYDDANEIAVKGDISAAISATNQTFSSAVLAVNLDFATNTTGAAYVAVTNALAGFGFDAEALAELPGGKVYGSIGALLAALAAAVAWLKRKALIGGLTGGVPDDPKVHDFFTNADSFTPPTDVAGALKNSMLEKSIVLAVTENFGDADNTSYGSAT